MHSMVESIRSQFDAVADRPHEIVVEFGLKVQAEAGVVIVHTSGEANLQVRLPWERDIQGP
jgi:hypothetical protein